MTMGPALIFLYFSEGIRTKLIHPVMVFGKVPLFFYVIHLYLIHALAMLYLVSTGKPAGAYVLSAANMASGRLGSFGLGLEAVYVIWIVIIVMLYPLCRQHQKFKQGYPSKWWLGYL